MKKILSAILSLMLVFAGMAPAALAENTLSNDATLLDISFDNHSVVNGEFNPEVTSYTVQQPYRFSKDGNNYKDAPVTVIKSDKNAEVGDIERIDNENNTQTITIPVTAADGVTKKTYTLTVAKVGRNQYGNPGFEEEVLATGDDNWTMTNGAADMERSTAEKYAGNYSLKVVPSGPTGYPSQYYDLTNDVDVTFFSSFAVKSTLTMRVHNVYTSYLSGGSHYYIDDNGDVIKNEAGDILNWDNADFTTRRNLLTGEDANGWQRSMRISKGLNALQETATSGDASGKHDVYFDEFYLAPLVIGNVNVTSNTEGYEGYVRCGEEATINFDEEILNQYGNKGGLANETVTWHLINAPEGVAIDEVTGVVTVAETVSEAGEFYVEARVVPTFNQGITSSWSIHCQSWMGGRAKVSVIPYNASSLLSDIEVNGGSVYGFASATTAYDIYVPYVYQANNFSNFAMPTVSATPVNADGNVEITYPDAVADGEKIYIDVTDASGVLATRYTLTIKTVGGNLFPDGGFETEAVSSWKSDDYGVANLEIKSYENASGSRVMGVESYHNGNSSMMTYASNISLPINKTYAVGFWARVDAENTADTVTYAPEISVGRKSNPSAGSGIWRAVYTTNSWCAYSGGTAGNTLTFKKTGWSKLMTTFPSRTDGAYNIALTLPSATTAAKMLYDELYLGELVIANMEVKDSDNATAKTVTVPAAGATETINLTPSIKNQYGNTVGLTGETYAWRELVDYAGVSVDNGVVTVADNAAPGKVVIEATVTPSYTGAAQPQVSKRYTLTILPRDGVASNGNTYTVTFTNKTGTDLNNLSFISAIYEGTALKSVLSTNNISAANGETITRSHDLAVGNGQTIKHFLWDKTTLTPYIAQ